MIEFLEVIRELIEANESEEDAAIVILAEDDKEKMDNTIRDNITNFATTRVITDLVLLQTSII